MYAEQSGNDACTEEVNMNLNTQYSTMHALSMQNEYFVKFVTGCISGDV